MIFLDNQVRTEEKINLYPKMNLNFPNWFK